MLEPLTLAGQGDETGRQLLQTANPVGQNVARLRVILLDCCCKNLSSFRKMVKPVIRKHAAQGRLWLGSWTALHRDSRYWQTCYYLCTSSSFVGFISKRFKSLCHFPSYWEYLQSGLRQPISSHFPLVKHPLRATEKTSEYFWQILDSVHMRTVKRALVKHTASSANQISSPPGNSSWSRHDASYWFKWWCWAEVQPQHAQS